MSIDRLAVGAMAAFLGVNLWLSVSVAFIVGVAFEFVRYQVGRKVVMMSKKDLSWLCGVFLILLALTKL